MSASTTRDFDLGAELTAAELQLLRQRAARYARRTGEEFEDTREAVVFLRGRGRYACPLEALREIRPLRKFCPMPGASRVVPGLVCYRGELLGVHDVEAFLNATTSTPLGGWILVGEHGRDRLALAADDVSGIVPYRPSVLHALPIALGERAACFQGLLADSTLVLNPPSLFSDEAFVSAY